MLCQKQISLAWGSPPYQSQIQKYTHVEWEIPLTPAVFMQANISFYQISNYKYKSSTYHTTNDIGR